jgi:glycosyltransferase involved in cell wall biosynthesis
LIAPTRFLLSNIPAMRILILQDHLRSGGTERQSVLLANELSGAGNEVFLLAFRPGGALAGTVSPAVRYRALQPFDTRLDWFAPGLRGAVAGVAPQVILCMGRMANCRIAFLKREFPGVGVVATMRTGKMLPWLYRQGLRWADHIVANSRDAARVLEEKYGVDAGKISVVYNAPVFAPEVVPAGAASGAGAQSAGSPKMPEMWEVPEAPTPSVLALLCVGMFRREKNQREILQIAASLPTEQPWQLWFAGDGPTRSACEKLAAEMFPDGRVRFFGFQADPRGLYRAASVGVLASKSESLPNFLVEAHLYGLPTVAFATGGVAECGGITVPPGNRGQFLEELKALLFSPTRRAAASGKVRELARQKFSREIQTAAYVGIFARVAGK